MYKGLLQFCHPWRNFLDSVEVKTLVLCMVTVNERGASHKIEDYDANPTQADPRVGNFVSSLANG